jgi:hypothetical protein
MFQRLDLKPAQSITKYNSCSTIMPINEALYNNGKNEIEYIKGMVLTWLKIGKSNSFFTIVCFYLSNSEKKPPFG